MDTWALEFRVRREFLQDRREEMVEICHELVKQFFGKSNIVYKDVESEILRAFFTEKSGIGILVQGKKDGLLTVDINWPIIDDLDFQEKVIQFGNAVQQAEFYLKPKTREYPYIPPLKRGRAISLYSGCDTLLAEYDFDHMVYDEISPYQHIRILHSVQHGNCLLLDNDTNIADSDFEYTRAITGFGLENYTDKTVLILGGGDGGILHYLRDRGPKMITMIDIDKMVIEAAKIHLREICHDALDSLSGNNYEVIIDDCVKYLEKYASEKREFDYVINDLTGVPVSTEPVGDQWDFLRRILSLSMKVLKTEGKYFSYGCPKLRPDVTIMYEKQLLMLECPVKFEKQIVRVPSYLEDWYFYTIWKDV